MSDAFRSASSGMASALESFAVISTPLILDVYVVLLFLSEALLSSASLSSEPWSLSLTESSVFSFSVCSSFWVSEETEPSVSLVSFRSFVISCVVGSVVPGGEFTSIACVLKKGVTAIINASVIPTILLPGLFILMSGSYVSTTINIQFINIKKRKYQLIFPINLLFIILHNIVYLL